VAGDCVVLAFTVATDGIRDNRDGSGAPLKQLFGFKRLHDMAPGEKRSVLFSSTPEDFSVVDSGERKRHLCFLFSPNKTIALPRQARDNG
jgi:hypothetical protein